MPGPAQLLSTASASWLDELGADGFGCRRVAFDLWSLRHLGWTLEELPPGYAICPLHRHQYEEEHLYVLDGTLTIREWHGGVHRTFSLHAGELVTWLPGTGPAHQTSNTGDRPARYVVASGRHAQEIAHYPESGKVLLRGAGVGVMTARGQSELPLDAHYAAALAQMPHPALRLSDVDRPGHVVRRDQPAEKSLGRHGGFGRALSRFAGATSVFVNLDRLPPGARTADIHAHLADEEIVLVVAGRPTLRQWQGERKNRAAVFGGEPERTVLQPGDALHWAPGDLRAHHLVNESADDALLLVVGTDFAHDIVLYPERDEVFVPALDVIGRFRATDYMAGEGRR
ncbi:MAG: cupin domain-containing protein [Deltaproteobacteria bacterium]|nr:cupin domain-containing protein [Deltaproteobacteria bacterium]